MARAPRLHRGGWGFKSLSGHRRYVKIIKGPVAQLAEQQPFKLLVPSSSLGGLTKL